ncbi:flavin reductase [Geothrix limicola]|uniref:Flavin reductase n=2 Tax=Geothrix limicola TaxID=2927978 RepID=A0ABQ5QCV2_9BACT|nr:flavin reductase family protein [Geothrix limicola]GLH72286.1 flavin reductase [Geothrix limicola]
MMKALPLSKVYQLLEPGPVVLLTTAREGRPNVMAMSWHMMMEFEPPLVGCIVSNANHSFTALKKTGEAVIAIPPAEFAPKVVEIGNCSGRDLDKFTTLGLAMKPAKLVAAPLLPDCFANLECRVADARLVTRYGLFVLEVIQAWIDPARRASKTLHHRGFGTFAVDGDLIHLASGKP